MKLTGMVQESLLALLCFDGTDQGAKVVRALVPFKSYDPYFRQLAELADAYIEKYKKPPGDHTTDLIEQLATQSPDNKEQYLRILDSLLKTKDVINREYVIAQASKFVRRQRLKTSLAESIKLLQKDDEAAIDEAEGLLGKTLKGSVDLAAPGLLFNDPAQALRFLDEAQDDTLNIGIQELDKYGLGPTRASLWLMIAPPNRGKTWCAVHKGKHALLAGRNVLHVTLEMKETKIAQRYVQALYSVSKREAAEVAVKVFRKDEMGRSCGFDDRLVKGRPHFDQENIREVLTKKMKPLARRARLIIKQFPSGTLTIRQLRAYLDHLEGVLNFIPDLLIVDYADLMQIDPKHKRNELSKLYVDLAGIATERNIFVATYSQSNREGLRSKIIGMDKVAEDISKTATAHTIITFNQTDAEQEMGLARLFVAKARDDVKHFQVLISQAYAIGQFCFDSARMESSTYWPLVDEGEEENKERKRKGKRAA